MLIAINANIWASSFLFERYGLAFFLSLLYDYQK